MMSTGVEGLRKPPWLKVRLGLGPNSSKLKRIVESGGLHTVCDEALCPNKGRCWEHGRATLMILGGVCTRGCGFCNVAGGVPDACREDEPSQVAEAVRSMGLSEVVITSVTRDDLADGGAGIWAETISMTRDVVPGIVVEVLIPDFQGCAASLKKVMEAAPEVLGHNLETVPSLYRRVRPQADYRRSLEVLRRASEQGIIVKTGIMVGLGETEQEVLELMADARSAGCDILTVGQYLRPTGQHLPVESYVDPGQFEFYRSKGQEIGFDVVVSGPLVRSSFHSEEQSIFVESRREKANR